MGISIECYRQRIGCFRNNSSSKLKGYSYLKKQKKSFNSGSFFSVLLRTVLLFTIFVCAASDVQAPLSSSSRFTSSSYLNRSIRCLPDQLYHHSGISWSSSTGGNKLIHALCGNKRNIGYKYLYWNCGRGFLSEHKIDDLKITIGRHKPHVIAVSEIDIKRNDDNNDEMATNNLSSEKLHEKFHINDYKIYLPKSWDTIGVARIVVYVRNDLKSKLLHPQDPHYDHVQNITLELGFGRAKPHFCNFYYREWTSCKTGRRDIQSQKDELQLLLDIWRNCFEEEKDFIAMGDMNLCAKKWREPSYEHKDLANQIHDFMNEEDCSQIVDSITRIQSVGGNIQRSCLDHATVNCVNKVSTPVVIGVGRSDHLGVILTKASKEIRTSARTTRKRIYKNFDREAFLNDVDKAKKDGKFAGVLSADDPDDAFDHFEKSFCELLETHAPLKVIQNRTNYIPHITPKIKQEMDERNSLKELAAESGLLDDFNRYKKKRNEVTMLLKSAEKDYHDKKFREESSSKSVWSTAYEILGNQRTSFPSQILHCGRLISNPKEIAAEVNKFFVDKIRKLKEEFETDEIQEPLTELKTYLSKKNVPRDGFNLKELDNNDMKKLLKNLKGKKSSGMDWICGYTLKIASPILIEELAAIVNLCIRKKRFVKKWKCAKVLPAWKNKGTRFELKFYRPLSNLSEVSKLVERAIYDQMYEYLDSNDLIHPNHHGFLKNSSTSSALQHVLDIWLKHIDKGKLAAALFLDLSAGFDVINHRILLLKMKEYNFTEDSIGWFSSYLLDRSQSVQVESSLSPSIPVPWGVPQGSILGPLLFLFYINELPDIVKKANDEDHDQGRSDSDDDIIVYADDNTPTTAEHDPFTLQINVQNEADIVTNWFNKNDMVCSSDKTKLLVIGTNANRKNKLIDKNISLKVNVCGDTKLETTSEKLLGIVVNNTATFHHHLHGDEENPGLLKQLSTRVGMLKRLKRFMTPVRLKMIMEGMFTSKLMYGMTVWGRVWQIPGNLEEVISPSLTKDDLRKLQVLKNKCLRLVTNCDYKTPTVTLLEKTKSLSVHQHIAQLSLSQVFNIYHTKAPVYHYNRLFRKPNSDVHIDTRTNNDYSINRINFKLSLCRTNFFYQASRLWASLPTHIKSSRNKNTFKKKSKSWVKSNIVVKP